MRTKGEQRRINSASVGRRIADALIARHGILQAVEISQEVCISVAESLTEQKRRHPEEWPREERALPVVPKISS